MTSSTFAEYVISYTTHIVWTFACGVQFFMFLSVLSAFLSIPKQEAGRRAKLVYLIVFGVIFCLFSVNVALGAYEYGIALVLDRETYFKVNTSEAQLGRGFSSKVCTFLVSLIGESLLLYRCYIVYLNRRWVMIFPGVLYFIGVGVTIMTLLASIPPFMNTLDEKVVDIFHFWTNIAGVPTITALCNSVTTGLIIYRLLSCRRRIQRLYEPSPGQATSGLPAIVFEAPPHLKQYTSISATLAESALPLSVSGLLVGVSSTIYVTTTDMDSSMFIAACLAWYVLAAICPQYIIYRVMVGRSWIGSEETGNFQDLPPLEAAMNPNHRSGPAAFPDFSTELGSRRLPL